MAALPGELSRQCQSRQGRLASHNKLAFSQGMHSCFLLLSDPQALRFFCKASSAARIGLRRAMLPGQRFACVGYLCLECNSLSMPSSGAYVSGEEDNYTYIKSSIAVVQKRREAGQQDQPSQAWLRCFFMSVLLSLSGLTRKDERLLVGFDWYTTTTRGCPAICITPFNSAILHICIGHAHSCR